MIQLIPIIFGIIKIVTSFFSSDKLKIENLKQTLINEAKNVTKKEIQNFILNPNQPFSDIAKDAIGNIMSQLNKTEQLKFANRINQNDFMLKNFNISVQNEVVTLKYKGFMINFSVGYNFENKEIKAGVYAG